MDVFGNMNFQIISFSDAANSKSVLSLFAARFYYWVKPFSSDHIEDTVIKAAYTKAYHTPPTDFIIYATAFLICSAFIYCSLQNKQYAKVTT